ncbi:MAG TPA: bifunctional nuclease domain-containing protein [Flavipsychrobacter sp.]|jgi:bifunctional DNase/RNase|nr:bifunctional nuclease domain-containing protein [Flavipsychrobacter sp.]
MKKIELEIVALSHSITQTHSYAVVLGEVNGLRRLPIVIGGFEAQAIAVALERMQPSRPLTHDLFANFMSTFGIDLLEVVIYKLEEGIFFAKLNCQGLEGDAVEIDSRTSDALALAVRANCRIYTYENILESAGLYLDQPEGGTENTGETAEATTTPARKVTSDKELKNLSLDELNALLQQVLEQEDYVRAISIRDEINTRKGK